MLYPSYLFVWEFVISTQLFSHISAAKEDVSGPQRMSVHKRKGG